jgi:hypothetical protein
VTGSERSAPSAWAVVAHEVHKRALRSAKRALRPLWLKRLDERNRDATAPLLSPAGPVVSLTTYEPRWATVHYTIESIGAGELRPSRLLLWIAPSVLALGTPDALQRQIERGVELRTCEDLGPHKKYYPLVAEGALPGPMVTADDDVLYGAQWLQGLAQAAAARPDCIQAHRAHVMSFDDQGGFLPYHEWPACRSTVPSALHFSTGVGGVLFPPAMQQALRDAGDAFRACCPRADDIWLNAVAYRAGVPVRQTQPFSPLQFEIPGTRSHGLAQSNRESGGNDAQLRRTYSDDERARLFALSRQEAAR